MHVSFEELDYQRTAIDDLILRRRRALEVDGREIFEVKLGDGLVVEFENPIQGNTATNGVYVAKVKKRP